MSTSVPYYAVDNAVYVRIPQTLFSSPYSLALRSVELESPLPKLSRRSHIERRMPPKLMSRADQAIRARKMAAKEKAAIKRESKANARGPDSDERKETTTADALPNPTSSSYPGLKAGKNRRKKENVKKKTAKENNRELLATIQCFSLEVWNRQHRKADRHQIIQRNLFTLRQACQMYTRRQVGENLRFPSILRNMMVSQRILSRYALEAIHM